MSNVKFMIEKRNYDMTGTQDVAVTIVNRGDGLETHYNNNITHYLC